MAAADEDALRCDFAQVYRVLDFRRLPLRTAAVLACGLPEDSRIIRKLSGSRIDVTTALLARIFDGVMILAWQNTEDGHKGRNPPKSLFEHLTREDDDTTRAQGFASAADFRAAWAAITAGGETNE